MVSFAPQEGFVTVVTGPMWSGKCLAEGTEVLMHDGSLKRVEDICVGDRLMGDDSTPRTVLSTNQGRGALYEVRPQSSGKARAYVANEQHVLSLKCSHSVKSLHRDRYRVRARWLEGHKIHSKSFAFSKHGGSEEAHTLAREFLAGVDATPQGAIIDISVADYLAQPYSWRALYKGYRVPIEFPRQDLPYSPYLLGLWLGDGHTRDPSFTNTDGAIVDFLKKTAQEQGLHLVSPAGRAHTYRLSSKKPNGNNPFLSFLRTENLWGNKHIPHRYLTGSRTQRLELLAGLVDTDGHYTEGYSLEFTLASKRLADDIVRLANTLGFSGMARPCKKTCTNGVGGPKEGDYYRFHLSGDGLHEIPTRVPHKRIGPHSYRNNRLVGIKVEPVGVGAYYGFMVDGNGRFLLADGVVTHNSTELIRLLVRAEVAGKKVAIFKPAVDDRSTEEAVVSRHGFSHPAFSVQTAADILSHAHDYDVVAIDEAQFFDAGIVAVVEELAAGGSWVIVAGLDLDFRRHPFGSMAELMVRAEFVEKLQAVCHRCGGPAFFTQRLVDGKPAPFTDETVLVGDLESYEARCRACYEPGK